MHCVINQLLRKYKASTAVVFSGYLTFAMEMTGKTKELGWPNCHIALFNYQEQMYFRLSDVAS